MTQILVENRVLVTLRVQMSVEGVWNSDIFVVWPFVFVGVFADVANQQIEQTIPWRNDCDQLCTMTDGGPFGSYCAQNPCGLPASVTASRANWCPGSETAPYQWTPAGLSTPGSHSFRFAIDGIYQGAQWRVSATVYAYGN